MPPFFYLYCLRVPELLGLFEELLPDERLLPAEEREPPLDGRLLPAEEREPPPDDRLLPTDERELPPLERVPPTERELGEVDRLRLLPTKLGDRLVGLRRLDDPDDDRAVGRL